MLELLTPRLKLRQISVTDWPLFVRLHQEHDIIRYVFDKPSLEEIKAKFRVLLPLWQPLPRRWLCLVVCCRKSNSALGTMAFIINDDTLSSAEFGYMFLPEHFGKGYATEALETTKQFAMSLGVARLQATVTAGNSASCRVLEKCGFSLSKTIAQAYSINNQLYDDLVYICQQNDLARAY